MQFKPSLVLAALTVSVRTSEFPPEVVRRQQNTDCAAIPAWNTCVSTAGVGPDCTTLNPVSAQYSCACSQALATYDCWTSYCISDSDFSLISMAAGQLCGSIPGASPATTAAATTTPAGSAATTTGGGATPTQTSATTSATGKSLGTAAVPSMNSVVLMVVVSSLAGIVGLAVLL